MRQTARPDRCQGGCYTLEQRPGRWEPREKGTPSMRATKQPRAWRGGAFFLALLAALAESPVSRASHRGSIILGAAYPAHAPVGVYGPAPGRPLHAFVDTDIHPEDARVYLDGRLIGVADDFDGFPGFLVLKPGRHTLTFSLAGFHSLSFTLELRPGELADLDRKLPRLSPGEKDTGVPPPQTRGRVQTEGESGGGRRGTSARRGEYGVLRLSVSPPEARVALDGDFFGTGAEISRLHAGIPLSPGIHRIRVSREGYRGESLEVRVVGSEERAILIELKER